MHVHRTYRRPTLHCRPVSSFADRSRGKGLWKKYLGPYFDWAFSCKEEQGSDQVIVGHVTEDMDIYKTESFGPTVSFITVESEEDAVTVANDTEYGLTAAVFSENRARAFRVAKQLESGYVISGYIPVIA